MLLGQGEGSALHFGGGGGDNFPIERFSVFFFVVDLIPVPT